MSLSEVEPRLVDADAQGDERGLEGSLRPQTFAEYVGQSQLKENLEVFVEAARLKAAKQNMKA